MSSNKRPSCPKLNEHDLKRRKVEDSKPANFLALLKVFILQAGIEKTRMNIFKTQLEKYGGEVFTDLNSDATHLVVDDKMEVDRMCRLLKLSSPPTDICIVKSSWLSGCFRHKTLLDTSDYLLDCSKFTNLKEADTNCNEDVKDKHHASTDSELNKNIETESKSLFPKVGVMFGQKGKVALSDSEDSDYCQSVGESDVNSDHSRPTSATITPENSPNKNLPVSIQPD